MEFRGSSHQRRSSGTTDNGCGVAMTLDLHITFKVSRSPVALAEGTHPVTFRTRKLSPPAPMVLPGQPGGRVGRRGNLYRSRPPHLGRPRSRSRGIAARVIVAHGSWSRHVARPPVDAAGSVPRVIEHKERPMAQPPRRDQDAGRRGSREPRPRSPAAERLAVPGHSGEPIGRDRAQRSQGAPPRRRGPVEDAGPPRPPLPTDEQPQLPRGVCGRSSGHSARVRNPTTSRCA
jgi:hypothetical protein